jgi:hypothetical protein
MSKAYSNDIDDNDVWAMPEADECSLKADYFQKCLTGAIAQGTLPCAPAVSALVDDCSSAPSKRGERAT